ncbi:GxxExxY protein [Bernardetia sp. Wsw4-3y2]|uniref:GxxExxY protein n=1 Tax=Bernardetia sp. Wsw4-3y2 TaxID=3127471 RepID=UPI0030CD7B32
MQKANYQHSDLTKKIIGAFFTVYNTLGHGFLEAVYEKALHIELTKIGIKAQTQIPIKVYYNDFEVGHYFADILVEDKVILELKAIKNLLPEHEAQLQNYLKATGLDVGLLLNFGIEPVFKRRTRQVKS